jgi:galactokinase
VNEPAPGDARVRRLLDALGQVTGARTLRAPGRVNLIGDHTDHQRGFCLPLAIDRDVLVAFVPRDDRRVVVRSLDLDGTVTVAADGSSAPREVDPPWGRLVAGAVRALAAHGRTPTGLDAVVSSDVPLGAGLSSSAAFGVAVTMALATVGRLELDARALALAAQDAEHVATGVPCGIMDQLASVAGHAGCALLIDCRSLDVEPIPLPGSLEVLVVHSGLPRTLESSQYAERRRACEAVAARLGLTSLRDATPDQVADEPFARHVVSESARTVAFADALRRDDVAALGPLMLESHASLRDDFAVSTPELDALVEGLVGAGALGARLTGAGFGGCVVALVATGRLAAVADDACARYRLATGREPDAFAVRASDGAGPVD